MSVPARFNMQHYHGDPWDKTFVFSGADLTDLVPKLVLERDGTETDWSSYLSLTDSTVTMAVPASAVAALSPGAYDYDLKFVDGSAVTVRTYLVGRIDLIEDVNA